MERIEFKAAITVDDTGAIEGLAWPFGAPDRYGDEIMPGSFKGATGPLPMLAFHEQRDTVGVWDSITETAKGLVVKGRLLVDHVARAAELRALIRAGALGGLSIGFVSKASKARQGGGRTISKAELLEISIVAVPAHPGARITSAKGAMPGKESTMDDQNGTAPEIAELETKLGALDATVKGFKVPDISPLETRLAELEKRANRPAGGGNTDEQAEVERKALVSLIRTGSDVEVKAATSSSDPEGGWMILPTVDMSIRNLLKDVSPLRQLANVVSISGNTFECFYSTAGTGAQWVGETDTRPQDTSRPELIRHSYGVAELYACPAGTRHLFEDASIDIASWFNTWTVNDFAVTEGNAFLRGDGVNGKPRGLATYPIVATADATRAWGEMQFIPAGHASAPTDENWSKALVKTVLTLHPKHRPGAAWLMNSATLIRIREIQDANKRFMWSDHGNLSESPESGTLLGYPVHIDNGMDDIGAGNHPIAFGNFSQGYNIIDRHGIRIVRDEVSTKGVIKLDTYKRVGGGLGDSNAVKWLKVATS